MTPVTGVEFVQGDFQEIAVLQRVRKVLHGTQVEVVMSDMAPNISGIRDVDQARSMALAELALEFTREVCSPGGTLLVKVFQGKGYNEFRHELAKALQTGQYPQAASFTLAVSRNLPARDRL